MLHQMTFEDLPNVTFSPASPGGVTRCNLPAGMQTVRSGQALAPVRHSAPLESKRVFPMSGICCQPSLISSKSVALNMSLANRLKTQLSTVGSIEYIETWKEKATPAGVLYWAHTASVPRIKDNGCTGDAHLLPFPTPTQNNATGAGNQGRLGGENLQTAVMAVAAYHTPRANDAVKNGAIANDPRNGLPAQVLIMPWPKTPMAGDAEGGTMEIRPGTTGKYKLRDYAATAINPWPTILSSEARQGFQDRTRGKKGSQESLSTVIYRVIQVILGSVTNSSTAKTERFGGYRLNPYFSAWLMGFPKEWTEAGMAAFQKLTASRLRGKKKVARCS